MFFHPVIISELIPRSRARLQLDPHHVFLFACRAGPRVLQWPHLLVPGPDRANRARKRAIPRALSRKCVARKLNEGIVIVKPHFRFSGGAFASLASLAWNKQRNYHSHGASGARSFPRSFLKPLIC